MKCPAMFPLFFSMIVGRVGGEVMLNEVMFNPLGPEATDEFVEIFNAGEEAVDLSGWKIGDGSGEDGLIDAGWGTVLLPGRFGLILDPNYFESSTTYDSLIPDTCLLLTLDGSTFGSSGLSNSQAETVVLIDPAGRIVDSHTYDIEIEAGHSSERMYVTETPDPNAWGESRSVNGTPGGPNSITKQETDLALLGLISLLGEENPFEIAAQIVNAGLSSITEAQVHFYHDADGDGQIDPFEEIGTSGIKSPLSAGDTAWVSIFWDDAPSGRQQIVLFLETEGDQESDNNLLTGEVIVPFASGSLVINEVMFQPPSGEPEWFELFNRSDVSINLCGWVFSDSDTTETALLTGKEIAIASNGFAVVSSDTSIALQMPQDAPVLVPSRFPGLNNDTDVLFIRDPTGRIIDRVPFGGAWLYSENLSLERIHPDQASDDPSNWYGCTDIDGMTPGKKNSVFAERPITASALSVAPNPFSPDGDGEEDVAAISYRLSDEISTLRIRIYDVIGRCVKTLRSGSPSGSEGTILWNGQDDFGKPVQIGIYIVHLEALGKSRNVLTEEKTTLVVAGEL